jgi:2'-5' RNA ligase
LPDGEAPEQLHVTLVYFGDADEVENTDKLPAIIEQWAQDKAPVSGVVNGGGQFSPGPDGRTPSYANFDAPELPAWRQDLVEHIQSHGYEPRTDHGYTPHITLAYSDAGETPPPLPEIPKLPLTFGALSLVIADERHDFPLRVQEVIRKQDDGWHLYSKDGEKHLGGPYSSRDDAEKRERQVQFFKQETDMSDDGRIRENIITNLWPVREAEKPFTGREWEVTIIGAKTPGDVITLGSREFVKSKNGRYYACDNLRKSAPEWEGVKVYDNHLTDEQFEVSQGMRSVKDDWIGTIVRPKWDETRRRLRGVFKVVDEGLAKKLLEAFEQKVLHTIGLSIDTAPQEGRIWHDGREWTVIEGFKRIFSVDLVAEPAAGGGFDRILASEQQERIHEIDEEVQAFVTEAIREAMTETLRRSNGRLHRAQQQGLCTPGVQREVARLRETLNQAGVALAALESNLSKVRRQDTC